MVLSLIFLIVGDNSPAVSDSESDPEIKTEIKSEFQSPPKKRKLGKKLKGSTAKKSRVMEDSDDDEPDMKKSSFVEDEASESDDDDAKMEDSSEEEEEEEDTYVNDGFLVGDEEASDEDGNTFDMALGLTSFTALFFVVAHEMIDTIQYRLRCCTTSEKEKGEKTIAFAPTS